MPSYCFANKAGTETVERDYPMGRAPSRIRLRGVPFDRDIRADALIFGHGGGRQCTSAINGMAISTMEEVYEITLDKSVSGCYRSFNIRDIGVSQYSKDPSQKITFTPTKPGTYTFACSMGMGYGKLIVK